MPTDAHHCRVLATPWPEAYGTLLHSARHFGRHWHGNYGVGLLQHGAQSSASGLGPVDAYAGDLITSNPGEVHDGRPLGGPSRRWRMLHLEPALMRSMVGVEGDGGSDEPQLVRPVIQDPPLRQALHRLFARLDAWQAGGADSADALACEEALVQLCSQLLARHATAAPLPEVAGDVHVVRERLADLPLAAPTLAELAQLAGLSRYQVLRRFERAYGLPPHAWLLQRRAERARTLVLGGAALADAAAQAGFADQSHMTRVFARQFGFTPGALQRRQP